MHSEPPSEVKASSTREDALPTTFELASLTAAVFVYNPLFSSEDALDEALRLYQRAQTKLEQVREEAAGNNPFDRYISEEAKLPRLRFEESRTSDEAREFVLKDAEVGNTASTLKVRRGREFMKKLHLFCLDRAKLQEHQSDGESDFRRLLQCRSTDKAGRVAYDLLRHELVSFKSWLLEIQRLQSKIRGKRKGEKQPCATDDLIDLTVAAYSGAASEDTVRRGCTARAWSEERSRKTLGEMRSLNEPTRRTYQVQGQLPANNLA